MPPASSPRLSTKLLAAGAFVVTRPLSALLRRRWKLDDGMRRCAAVNLRGEAAKFVLSAIGLRVSQLDLTAKLQQFLQSEPGLRWTIATGLSSARPRRNPYADLAVAQFAADGSLESLEPMLEGVRSETLATAVTRELVRAYNRTRHEDDIDRPARLVSEWFGSIEHHARWPAADHCAAEGLAMRVLRATWLSFDESTDRFRPPDFYNRKHAGLGALNVVARAVAHDEMDLWFQFHHAAFDGAPAQEAINRLATQWGRAACVFAATSVPAAPQLSGVAHARRIERTQDFFDFQALLAARREVECRLDRAITGGPHLSALLLWCLARQPEFEGRRFSLAVELPANARSDRTFTFLSIRPADYFSGLTGSRLSAYVREFNRLLTLCRRREGATHAALANLALLPPGLIARCLAENTGAGAKTFGTFGVTLLPDAEIFLAPIGDTGFADGFLAIGCMNLPSHDGRVGSASFAAPNGLATAYRAALRRALAAVNDVLS